MLTIKARSKTSSMNCTFCIFEFLTFFVSFLALSGHLGILGLLVSYEVTRGTILVVGTVHDGFWGVWGGLLYPCMALFALLEVLYGTRFGSKHYRMFKLANICWGGITDPFLAHCGPFSKLDWLAHPCL